MVSSRVPDDSVGSQMVLRGGVVDPVGRGAGEKKIDVPDQEKLQKASSKCCCLPAGGRGLEVQ